MSISLVDSEGALTGTAATSATMPAWGTSTLAPASGDLLILFINARNTTTGHTVSLSALTGAGWSIVTGSPFQYYSTDCSGAILYKVSAGSESTPPAATCGATTFWEVYSAVFRSTTGFPPNPFDQSAHSATSTTAGSSKASGTTGTLGYSDSLVVSMLACSVTGETAWTLSGGGFTNYATNKLLPATNDAALQCAWYEASSTTALTTTTWGWSTTTARSVSWVATFYANAPAPSGTPWATAVAALANKPQIWWRMNATSAGTTKAQVNNGSAGATDAGTVGNGTGFFNGSLSATSLVASDSDTAIAFAATGGNNQDSLFCAADAANLQPASAFSIACFIKPTTIDTTNGNMLCCYGDSSGNAAYQVFIFPDGRIAFAFESTGSVQQNLLSAGTVVNGSTYFLVVTYDGATMKIYLNGAQDGNTTSIATSVIYTNVASPVFSFGGWSAGTVSGTTNFVGTLDEGMFIGGHALTSAEVTALYNGALGTVAAIISSAEGDAQLLGLVH